MKSTDMYKKIVIGIIVLIIMIFIPVDVVFALENPSAVYCEKMGYKFVIEKTEAGQIGVCKFSETESCPAWDFLTGKCGKEYSYCKQKGYEIKTISDSEKCHILFSSECAVCVLPDGTEVEVTRLMNLSFEEGVCGDGRCVLGENYATCPQDCHSGSHDWYCDKVVDGICDPDCLPEEDIDCMRIIITEICGDGLCNSPMENHMNCPQDCPSGGKDNYCDALSDGICDPDCKIEEDIDCKRQFKEIQNETFQRKESDEIQFWYNFFAALIAGIIGIIILFLIARYFWQK